MSGAQEAAVYFKNRPLQRLMEACRQTYVRLSRVGGTAFLEEPTDEEVQAVRELFGREPKIDHRGRLSVRLVDLDDHLQNRTRFVCGLVETMAVYYGESIVTRHRRKIATQRVWDGLVADANRHARSERSRRWIDLLGTGGGETAEADAAGEPAADSSSASVSSGRGIVWRVFREAVRDPSEGAVDSLRQAVRWVSAALSDLPREDRGTKEPLPIFAQRITGDPHAFDGDQLAGRLLERAIAETCPHAPSRTVFADDSLTLWRDAVFMSAGIQRDDVSSTILVAGLETAWNNAGERVRAVEALPPNVPVAWPLREVQRWSRARSGLRSVFVVENPALFMYLLDRLDAPAGAVPTLICTSGQPSMAGLTLLDFLHEDGAIIYYSGDFDPSGLSMAAGIKDRYQDRCRFWHMDVRDYEAICKAVTDPDTHPGLALTKADQAALERLRSVFPDLVPCMLNTGKKAFQEGLAQVLVRDVARRIKARPN